MNELYNLTSFSFSENYILPISHDEVVHGKGSLLGKMPGRNEWEKFANLRLFLGFMFTFPGKKLLFMGNDFGQWNEWNHDQSLDWHLIEYGFELHKGTNKLVSDLNRLYKEKKALHELDRHEGFAWNNPSFYWYRQIYDELGIISYVRYSKDKKPLVVVCNLTPEKREGLTSYHKNGIPIQVPISGTYKEIFNTDESQYGGSGTRNTGNISSSCVEVLDNFNFIKITLPPLGVTMYELQ